MRRVFSLVSAIILIALIVLIIQRSPDTSGPPQVPTDISTFDTPSSSTVPTTRTDSTQPGTTDSPPRTTDDTQPQTFDTAATTPEAEAAFVISDVLFGEGGYVVIRNNGAGPGSIGGFALCQRPSYLNLPDVELQPLDEVWVAVGDGSNLTATAAIEVIPANGGLGRFDRADGEMALYSSPNFAAPEAILSYVEWGESGHGRSSVAVEAGLWIEGAFVEIPPDAFGVSAVSPNPDSPDDWVAGLGG